jgi:cell division protein FtsB
MPVAKLSLVSRAKKDSKKLQSKASKMKPQKPAKAKVRSTRRPSSSGTRESMLRGLKLDTRTIALAAVLVGAIFTLAPQAQILIEQQQVLADLRAQVAASEQAVTDMKAERKRWEDPVYIRAQARDRLYYVMPGEVSYLVMDATGIDQSDTTGTVGQMIASRTHHSKITTDVRTDKSSWVDSLIETVVRSGIDQPVTKASK